MQKTRRAIKKIISTLIGLPVLMIGIILIPLPGPGVLITILGLFILSFGFETVKKPLDRYLQIIKALYTRQKQRYDEFIDKHDLK